MDSAGEHDDKSDDIHGGPVLKLTMNVPSARYTTIAFITVSFQ